MSTREVEITLNELINSMGTAGRPGALDKLLGAKLPAALAFRLSMLMDEVAPPVKHFNEQRESLLKEYGTPSEDGQTYNFQNGAGEKFQNAMNELGAEPVMLKVPALKVEDFGEREVLSAAEFFTLKWLFSANGSG